MKINLDELTPLEVAMLKTDLESFRDDRANEHYRVGRDMLARTRRPDAVKSFESALSMSGDFRYSDSARYLLGTTLRELGKYDRAIAVFREIEELERDTNVLAEVRYWLAYSLVRAGQKDQGTALFNQIVDGGGRHASSARRELVHLSRRLRMRQQTKVTRFYWGSRRGQPRLSQTGISSRLKASCTRPFVAMIP